MSDVSSLNTNMDMSALLEQAKYIADTQFATETLKSQVTTNNNAIMRMFGEPYKGFFYASIHRSYSI